jgi:hypothetical protein
MKVAADALSIVPFGYHDYVLSLHRNPFEVVVALALLAGGSALAFNLARRSGGGLSAHLAAGGIAVAVIGSFSLTRGDGPTYLYYAVWLSVASLAVMVALAVHEWSFRPWLPCVAMGVLIGSLALGQAPIDRTIGSGPWPAVDAQQRARTVTDTAVFGAAATRALLPSDRWVDVDIGAAGVWPYAAGLVLTLDEHGVQATVSPASWALYFGYERAPGRPVTAVLRLVPAGPTATHVIAQIDGTALEYRRTQVPSNGANP